MVPKPKLTTSSRARHGPGGGPDAGLALVLRGGTVAEPRLRPRSRAAGDTARAGRLVVAPAAVYGDQGTWETSRFRVLIFEAYFFMFTQAESL